MSSTAPPPPPKITLRAITKPRVWIPILVFVFALLVIGTTGFLLFSQHSLEIEETAHNDLAAIAELKVEQIARWMDERRGDAEVVSRDNLLAEDTERWFLQGAPEGVMGQKILMKLMSLRQTYSYLNIVLLDAKARPIRSANGGHPAGFHDMNVIEHAMQKNKVMRSDIYLSDDQRPEMILIAPLAVAGSQGFRVIGAVIFYIDPSAFLFPYIQAWPTQSPSAETLLVRREGNEVVFLSELRHRKGGALTLRLPIYGPLLPAAMVLRGESKILKGNDYRGIPVIVAGRKVPDTPWVLLAKIDRKEVEDPIRRFTITAGGLAALFILMAGAVAALWWRQQHTRSLALLYEGELQRQVLEQHLAAIVENSNDAIFSRMLDGTIVSWNPGAEKMLGYTATEVIGKPNTFILPPGQQPRLMQNNEKILGGELIPPRECQRMTKDGRVIDTLTTYSPVKDLAGKIVGVSLVLQDITESKRAREALVRAEEQFRGLVEQSIAGIYIIQDAKLVYVNPRFAELFGYASADELLGRDALSVIAENERAAVAENIAQWLKGEERGISYSATALRKDGSTIEVGVHGNRATYRDQPAIIGMLQDISEKKRAEEILKRHVIQLETALMSTVQVATTISEMRDPYTAGHEKRVAEIAVAIGAELGLGDKQLEGLRIAGHMHDIGKINIPAEILSKPGKLTSIEFQLIQQHPQTSYEILKNVEFPWPVAQVAFQHHERMDGSGYPQGLKGEAILFEARIMAVADVVEAMSSHRPYRPGLGIDKALAEIERGRETAYDADVAEACLRLFREKGYQLPA